MNDNTNAFYLMDSYRWTKVSCAVAAVNDYNNTVISSNDVFITVNGSRPYVKKADGFFVFTEIFGSKISDSKVSDSKVIGSKITGSKIPDEKILDGKIPDSKITDSKISKSDIIIKAGGERWQDKELLINMAENTGREIYIRMLAKERNQLVGNETVIIGSGHSGQVLKLMFQCLKRPYIASAGSMEGCLHIYHEGDAFLTGMEFMAEAEDKVSIIVSYVEDGEFSSMKFSSSKRNYAVERIDKPLSLMAKCRLKRIFTIKADDNGRFFFLVPKEAEGDSEFEYAIAGNDVPAAGLLYQRHSLIKNQVNMIL